MDSFITETNQPLGLEAFKAQLYNIQRDQYLTRAAVAIGKNTLIKAQQQNLLLIGANPLGAEVSRHLILNGCRTLEVWDPNKATIEDLTNNFFVIDSDIEEPQQLSRAQALIKNLHPLQHTQTTVKEYSQPEGPIKVAMLKQVFSTIIITSLSTLEQFLKIGQTGDSALDQLSFTENCHEEGINLLVGAVDKFWSFVFVDQCGITWEEEVEFLSLKSFLEFKAVDDQEEDNPRSEFSATNKERIESLLTGKIVISVGDEVPAMTTIIGALIAYQIVTGLQGLFPGIYQGFVWEEKDLGPLQIEAARNNDKYRFLIPGVGAIGCELIKLFAQMGLCDRVALTIIDFDEVALSNLNRQILFGKQDIGLNKASCAAKNIKALKPNIQLLAVEQKVDLSNPTSCNQSVWGNVDLVLNALDGYQARVTVHELCKIFRIPFLDSGLDSTYTKNHIYVPFQTLTYQEAEGYGNDNQNKEDSGSCTVRMRPTRQGHCLQWAREVLFEDLFVDAFGPISKIGSLEEYISAETDDAVFAETRNRFIRLFKALQQGDLEILAINHLRRYFGSDIKQLQKDHPEDQQNNGVRYWEAPARYPQTIELDLDDVNQWNFLVFYVSIVQEAILIGSSGQQTPSHLTNKETEAAAALDQICSKLTQNSAATWIERDEQFNAEDSTKFTPNTQDEALFLQIKEAFRSIQFDKDNPKHLFFLNGGCNLRLKNYHYQNIDIDKTNQIAAKIAGQVSYTSAFTAGVQVLQVLKFIAAGGRVIPSAKSNMICDIATNNVVCIAVAPQQNQNVNVPLKKDLVWQTITYPTEGFSNWDYIPRKGNTTPVELEAHIQQAFAEKFQGQTQVEELAKYRLVNYLIQYPQMSKERSMLAVDTSKSWRDILYEDLRDLLPDFQVVVLMIKFKSEHQVQLQELARSKEKLLSKNLVSEASKIQKQIRALRKQGIGPSAIIAPLMVQL